MKVLITGAARRIGKDLAIHFSKKGYDLILHYNKNITLIKDVQKECLKHTSSCEITACDFSNLKKVDGWLSSLCKNFGEIDILINNASIFEKNTLTQSSLNDLQNHFQINFMSPFLLMRDYANSVEKGQIINFLDTRINKNKFRFCAYTLSKKSLHHLTLMAANELGPKIRVNGIAPGVVIPPEGQDKSYLEQFAGKTPLKRSSTLEDIRQAADFLIMNSGLTGQIIYTDGGEHL